MAHTKSGGTTTQKGQRNPKYLGLKVSGGQPVITGNIILTQNGTQFHPGKNVGQGRNYTLFALKPGTVKFAKLRGKRVVHVV